MLEILRRIQYLLTRHRREQELAEEMEAHREIAARQRKSFGNSLRLREEARDAWGWTSIDRLWQDLSLRRPHVAKITGLHTRSGADAGSGPLG